MSDTIKISVWIKTDKVGSECGDTFEIDRAEWEGMDERAREGMAADTAFEMIEWGFKVAE